MTINVLTKVALNREEAQMIRKAGINDISLILKIINDSATAYKGKIPADCWREPYMSREELAIQLEEGVEFSCFVNQQDNIIEGVMGIQDRDKVNLIRHAYVSTTRRNSGVGSKLIQNLLQSSTKPNLVGTWKAADWAIRFYQKHGFQLVDEKSKNNLLNIYWNIPDRQIETSVVLVDRQYNPGFSVS